MGGDPSHDERAELEGLRAEVQALRSRPADPPRRRRIGWRFPVATLLIVIGCLLAPVAVLAVWTANQVSDTGRYVANVEPLVHNPAVQGALADKITNQITGKLDVKGLTDQAAAQLSGRGMTRAGTLLTTFAPSIASSIDGFIHSAVLRVVSHPAFATAWVQANLIAHAQLVTALSGRTGGAISSSSGQVTIDLAPFIAVAKQDLSARGFTLVNSIPTVHPTFVLFSSRDLVKAQTGYRLINDLKIVLPNLSLLLMGAGIYIARQHRRALIWAGLGLAGSMLLLAACLAIFRGIYLNSVPGSVLPSDAAAALFDTFVRFIKYGLRALLAVGLIVAAGGFLTGPSATAVRTRQAFGSGLGWVRRRGELAGLRTGPAGTWTYAHRKGLRISAVALVAVVFAFWGQPTALLAVVLVLLLLVALGLIELIGRPPAPPATAGHVGTA
jgi:hypothetical protein